MASGSAASASIPSVQSTFASAKRNSKDIGWEYGVIPDPRNPDRIKCTLCEKLVSGGITRLKQHIAQITGQTTSCSKATKEDQLKCRNAINEGKMKKQAKRQHDEAIRSEVRLDSSLEDDEVHDHSMKEPNVFGPMDNFANILNPEQSLEKGKGKKVELSNAIRKERMWMTKKCVARWAYESTIPFHAFEKDSFKMLLEVVGQFGPGLPPPTRYELSTPLLKEEVERTKNLVKRNKKEWKDEGCSIMTDAWSDQKRRSIMNLCVNSRMGTVFLSSKECSSEAHTSEYIYEYVDAYIQEVGAEHVVQIVTDNAYNNMGAAALLKVTRPKIFWTSCATHTINLMLEVDADWKLSMGFVYGEMIKAKKEIKAVLGDNKKAYEPIIKIIEKKMKGILDTVLHLMAYLLNPYYFYKDTEIQHDPDVSDAVLAFFEIILAGDLEMQLEVTNVEMPKYKKQMDRFGKELAIFACKIHTEKRNRLEASKLNNLFYVQFNSNLTKKAKRRKARDVEVLLSNNSNMAQEWIVECDGDGNRNKDEEVEVQDQQDQEVQWEVIGEAMEADEYLQPQQSSRTTTKTTQRELFDEEFEFGSEEVVYEEGDYESDGVEIIEDGMAQEWIVECDGDEEVEVQDQEAQREVIGEAMEADEYLQPRQSSRTTSKTTQENFLTKSSGIRVANCCVL
ncbi:putative transcription factor/ chromatin remodeling BED-type(Zn) family protein [Tanacetum coccineum]